MRYWRGHEWRWGRKRYWQWKGTSGSSRFEIFPHLSYDRIDISTVNPLNSNRFVVQKYCDYFESLSNLLQNSVRIMKYSHWPSWQAIQNWNSAGKQRVPTTRRSFRSDVVSFRLVLLCCYCYCCFCLTRREKASPLINPNTKHINYRRYASQLS